MASSTYQPPACVAIGASRVGFDDGQHSCRGMPRYLIAVLMAGMLSACAQSGVVADKSASVAVRSTSSKPAATVARQHTRVARLRKITRTAGASDGLASYYKHGSRTASGEKFNPGELTAAHRTLPFGTRVRVTNVATGKAVTVRVNDRGPFINGRVIDLSHSAAESLGIVGRGVAPVKLDVVR
jgi:rare lipoprotein A